MKVIFTKWIDSKPETREYEVTELRFGGYLTIMNIVDVGWRSITQDQYDEFTIISEEQKTLKKFAFF